jgi:hypothetical protein
VQKYHLVVVNSAAFMLYRYEEMVKFLG